MRLLLLALGFMPVARLVELYTRRCGGFPVLAMQPDNVYDAQCHRENDSHLCL
jgi:hypothetical protein